MCRFGQEQCQKNSLLTGRTSGVQMNVNDEDEQRIWSPDKGAITGEEAEEYFWEHAMAAATLRRRAIENVLRVTGFDAPGEGSAPLDHIARLLGDEMLDESGGLLNSAESTLRPGGSSDIYFLGLNPGGEAGEELSVLDNFPTVYESLAFSRLGVSGWDQDWSRKGASYAPGQAPIQQRFKHIARFLGLAYGEILATNLVFARSRRFKVLPGIKEKLEACLPAHQAMIDVVKPEVLWVMGNPDSAGGALKLHNDVEWRQDANHNNWSIGHGTVDFCGRTMMFCHTPHLTFWDADADDKRELLAFAFGARARR